MEECQHLWTQLLGRGGKPVLIKKPITNVVWWTFYGYEFVFFCQKCLKQIKGNDTTKEERWL